MEYQSFTLPAGFIDPEGKRHQEVELSVLGGKQEEWLANCEFSTPLLVTKLLAQCVKRLGDYDRVDEAIMSELLVADRDFIMLMLRQMTFGDRVESTLPCPWPECGQKIDIDFRISQIPITRCAVLAASYEIELIGNRGEPKHKVEFRLPNGSDQVALSAIVDNNEALALSGLLNRCITQIDSDAKPVANFLESLSANHRLQIDKAMEAVAPNLDLTMELVCPQCKRQFVAPFQIQDFFFGELQIDNELLLREVHYLAFHYHWSESDILEMPKSKRRRYIDVLSDEIGKMNDARA